MAKSTRSKVKRSFRSKKRETGVYAATEAARVQRLNAKLQRTINGEQEGQPDADPMEATTDNPGWSWFMRLGMLDPSDITLDNLSDYPSHSPRIWEAPESPTLANHSNDPDSMQLDTESHSKRISTHGPRGSRREEWRKSKGLTPRPASRGMNRQGTVAGRRKAGRSKRRR